MKFINWERKGNFNIWSIFTSMWWQISRWWNQTM